MHEINNRATSSIFYSARISFQKWEEGIWNPSGLNSQEFHFHSSFRDKLELLPSKSRDRRIERKLDSRRQTYKIAKKLRDKGNKIDKNSIQSKKKKKWM